MSKLNLIKKIKGFTLLEMLMTLAIFGIISGVVIFNYGDFNSEIVLSNTAYEIALQVREAQVFTLGVRAFGIGDDADFTSRYGVYFSSANPKNFIFFADQDGNFTCDGLSGGDCNSCMVGSECKNTISILRGIQISEICVSSDEEVFDENGNCPLENSVQDLTVTFKRPDPDAIIYDVSSGGLSEYPNAGIKITAPNGKSKIVIIRTTGQISVENI